MAYNPFGGTRDEMGGSSNMRHIVIPETCVNLEYEAFCSSGLEELYLKGSGTIQERAFDRCVDLSIVEIRGDGWVVGTCAFMNAGIKQLKLQGVERIMSGAFLGNDIEHLIIPSNCHYVGPMAFYRCGSLTEVDIEPNSSRKWAGQTFKASGLKSIPINLPVITTQMFAGCKIEQIVIPEKVRYVGSYAFSGCKAETIELNSNCVILGNYCFENNPTVSRIQIPASVTGIGRNALGTGNANLIVDFEGIPLKVHSRCCGSSRSILEASIDMSSWVSEGTFPYYSDGYYQRGSGGYNIDGCVNRVHEYGLTWTYEK